MSQKLGMKARRRLVGVDVNAKAETRSTDATPDVTINQLRSYIVKLHSQIRIAQDTAQRQGKRAEANDWDIERLSVKLRRATEHAKNNLWFGGAIGVCAGFLLGTVV